MCLKDLVETVCEKYDCGLLTWKRNRFIPQLYRAKFWIFKLEGYEES